MTTEPSDPATSIESLSDDDLYAALGRVTASTPFTVAELRAEVARRGAA